MSIYNQSKIAVSLASGQLGKAVINKLTTKIDKNNIIGIARSPKKINIEGIEVRKGDYDSPTDFDTALQGVDTLLLISGMAPPEQRRKQHKNIIEKAKEQKVRKIVYTSIIGDSERTAFQEIVKCNRNTELDLKTSGLDYIIGRNCIYIEPDLEYIKIYSKEGVIRNSAGKGKCGYTSRNELAEAYAILLLQNDFNNGIYNLAGKSISQEELANQINSIFGTKLTFQGIGVQEYLIERKQELGDFIGTVISGIYESIRNGTYDVHSHFEDIVGRPHKSAINMMKEYRKFNN